MNLKHPPGKALLRVNPRQRDARPLAARPLMVMVDRDARGSACGARCDRLRACGRGVRRGKAPRKRCTRPKASAAEASAAMSTITAATMTAITAAAMTAITATAMTAITDGAMAATAMAASEVAATIGNRLLRTWCRPDAGKGQMNRIINRCRLS